MAIVTNSLLDSLRTGFKGEFQRVYEQTPSVCGQIATVVPSSSSSNTYGWLGQFPTLREWMGERVLKDMKEHAVAIVNKLHESTVSVKRTIIEDDEVGIFTPLFGEMGRAAKVFPDELCLGLLKSGEQTPCFDGRNFFDVSHPVFPNADGTGTPLPVSNLAEGNGPAWYLLDSSRVFKAVIFQERTKPELLAVTAPEDEAVFMRDEYRYGIRYRCNAGFAFWQLAYCSKKALSDESFNEAYDAMTEFTADGGRPLGVLPTHLVVPTALRTAAREICVATRRDGGADNPNSGLVTPIITPWLN